MVFGSPVPDLCSLEQDNKSVAAPKYMLDLLLFTGWILVLKSDPLDKTDWTIISK